MEQAIQAPFPRITLEMTCRPFANRPLSIYQYSNMAPRLSGQNCNLFSVSLVHQFSKETKKTTPHIKVCPESPGAMLEY